YADWFIQQSREHGFQLVFYVPYIYVPQNHLKPLNAMERYGGTAGVLRRKAEEEKIPLIDLEASWRMMPDILSLLQDDCHPTAEGTVMQAEDIGRFLVENGLLE